MKEKRKQIDMPVQTVFIVHVSSDRFFSLQENQFQIGKHVQNVGKKEKNENIEGVFCLSKHF